MRVQAGVVGNLDTNRTQMSALVTSSQGATGALQATQAGNQLSRPAGPATRRSHGNGRSARTRSEPGSRAADVSTGPGQGAASSFPDAGCQATSPRQFRCSTDEALSHTSAVHAGRCNRACRVGRRRSRDPEPTRRGGGRLHAVWDVARRMPLSANSRAAGRSHQMMPLLLESCRHSGLTIVGTSSCRQKSPQLPAAFGPKCASLCPSKGPEPQSRRTELTEGRVR